MAILLSAGFFYMTQPDWRMYMSAPRNLVSGTVSGGGQALAGVPVTFLIDLDRDGKISQQDHTIGSVHTSQEGHFSLIVDHGVETSSHASVAALPISAGSDMGASLCFKDLSIPSEASIRRAFIRFVARKDASDGGECMISRIQGGAGADRPRRGTLLWHIPEIFRNRVYDSPDLSRFLRKSDHSPEFWVEGLTQLPFFEDDSAKVPVLMVEYVLPNRPYLLMVEDEAVGPAFNGQVKSIPYGPAENLALECPRRVPGQVSGRVFSDENGDGIAQLQEPGWREAELALYHDEDGFTEPLVRFRTGASGRFQWQADRTGTFVLRLRQQPEDSLIQTTTPREACLELAGHWPEDVLPEVEFGMR